MNSKMKSAFAIIAVALMIMVAVVPMALVFTGDSDATTKYDPEDSERATKQIKITVNIYKTDATLETVAKTVKVVWGSSGQFSYSKAVTGTATLTIDDTVMSKAKVYVMNGDDIDTAYGEAKVNGDADLTAGNTYVANLCNGFASKVITIYLKDGATTLSAAFAGVVKVKYSLSTAATSGTAVKSLNDNIATLTDGAASIPYQATATTVYMKIDKIWVDDTEISAIKSAAYFATPIVASEGASAYVTVDQYKVTISTTSNIPNATVSNISFKIADETPAPSGEAKNAVYVQSATIGVGKAVVAYHELADAAYAQYTVTYKSGLAETVAYASGSIVTSAVTYDPTGFYFGKATLVNKDITGTDRTILPDGTTFTITVDTTQITAGNYYMANGYYIAKKPTTATTAESVVKITSTLGKVLVPDGAGTEEGYNVGTGNIGAIGVSDEGYAKVDGTILGAPDKFTFQVESTSAIIGATTEAKSTYTLVTATLVTPQSGETSVMSASFSFYAKVMDTLKFTASAGTFTTASVGPFVVPAAGYVTDVNPLALQLVEKDLIFTFTDADGNAIAMIDGETKLIQPYYILPGEIAGIAANANDVAISGTYKNKVTVKLADYTLNTATATIKVYFENAGGATNTYAQKDVKTAVQYKETSGSMAISTNDRTYKLIFENADGQALNAVTAVNVYKATAAVVQDKTIIYTYDETPAGAVSIAKLATEGYATITLDKSLANVTPASLSVDNVVDTAVIIVTAPNCLFKEYYLFNADVKDGNIVTVEAYYDSYTGILTRLDKTTPIAGATVNLMLKGDVDSLIDTAVTDSDGEFTVYSKKAIKATAANADLANGDNFLSYSKSGYDSVATQKITPKTGTTPKNGATYQFATDAYKATVADSDGTVVYSDTLSVAGQNFVGSKITKSYTGKVALTAGTIITVTLTNRTINGAVTNNYTVTEDDVATGILSFTTDQSTYVVGLVDADGNMIAHNTETYKIYGFTGSEYVDLTDSVVRTSGWTYKNTVLTYVLDDPVSPYVAYYISATQAAAADKYVFSGTTKVLMDPDGTVLTSTSKVFLIPFTDAEGNMLTIDSAHAPTADGLAITVQDGMMRFIGVGSTEYTFVLTDTWVSDSTTPVTSNATCLKYFPLNADGTPATTAKYKLKPSAGALVSANQLYAFKVVDAALDTIVGEFDDVNVYGYLSETNKVKLNAAAIIVDDEGLMTTVGPADDYLAFTIESADYTAVGYTFDAIEGNIFIANEQTVEAVFAAVNGSVDGPDEYTFTAYGYDGFVIDSEDNAGIIVDVDKVAYYELVVTDSDDPYFPEDREITSLTNVFVSPITKVTGSLPVAAVADDYVLIEQYLGEQVVFTDTVNLAAGAKTYTIYVDVSGMVDETAGIAFDSIYATYVHDGAVYASVPVDPTAVFNPIVTPGSAVIQYVAVLVAPSAVIADHVGKAQVGNTVTVTADANFFVADDESIYTDGQYKYVFAGWYVDNEKVSANPVFTFTMTEDVVISPQYTVTYEKTSDVNKDVEKEYVNIVEKVEVPVEKTVGIDTNVLIIGICAVIVALIAVVYAVIKKE